jgi:hypothetical protein
MWQVGEPLHAVTYFAEESFAAWEAAGIRGFWRGYFATRAAPFGAVGAGPVTATFFNFAPAMVERALPAVWDLVTPEAALDARLRGSVHALHAILGEPDLGRAPALVREAALACDLSGRALCAANASLPWPDESLGALWHGLTLLREHRGDGHNAALLAAGLDGVEAHLLAGGVGAGGADADVRRSARGWSDDEWAAAGDRLRSRGLLDDAGEATSAARSLHTAVEARTDELAMGAWRQLGEDRTAALHALLAPLADAVGRSGVVRFPNPIGLPAFRPR